MQINATFGTGSTTNFESAVNSAISFFDQAFTNNITLNINFNEVSQAGGGLSSSSSTLINDGYSAITAALKGLNQTTDQTSAAAALPTSDPFGSGATAAVTSAEAKALGLSLNGYTGSDGTVDLNDAGLPSGDSWAWSQNSVGANQFDAVGAIEHEISEVMGRIAGFTDTSSSQPATGLILDTPEAWHIYTGTGTINTGTSGNGAYLSLDGGKTNLAAIGETGGGDIADWADPNNTANDAFGYLKAGVDMQVSSTDLREMNALGYSLAPETLQKNYDSTGRLTSELMTIIDSNKSIDTARIDLTGGSPSVTVVRADDPGPGYSYSPTSNASILYSDSSGTTTVYQGTSADEIILGGNGGDVTGGSGQNSFLAFGNGVMRAGNGTNTFYVLGGSPQSDTTVSDAPQLYGSNSTFYLYAGATATILGSNDVITAEGSLGTTGGVVRVVGSSDSVTVIGNNQGVAIGGNGQASNAATDDVVTYSAGTTNGGVGVYNGSHVDISGTNVYVYAHANDTVGVQGYGDVVFAEGDGDVISIGGNGQAYNSTTDDQVEFTNTNGGTVNVTDNSHATVFGNNFTVNAGNNITLGVVGSNDIANVTGNNDSVWAGGNGQAFAFSTDDTINFSGTGESLNIYDNSHIDAYGNNLWVNAFRNVTVGVHGSSETVNANVGGTDTVWIGGNGQAFSFATDDSVHFYNILGGTVNEFDNSHVDAYGNGLSVTAGTNDTLGVQGSGITVNANGNNDTVWASGNGQAFGFVTDDSIYFHGTGGTLNESDNSHVDAYGNGLWVNAGSSDTLGVHGSAITANANGNNDTVWAGGNGATFSFADDDSINFGGSGGVANEFDNSHIDVSGNGLIVNVGSNDTLGMRGTADKAYVNGNSDTIWIGGNGANATSASNYDYAYFFGANSALNAVDNSSIGMGSYAGSAVAVAVGNNVTLVTFGPYVIKSQGSGDQIV
ncbi:NF038122 family metalloprotease [Methylovirgula sp. 4M-Z18]|uniref:NF038122 family metalloprotease n=1 Tax=Methylovirgula sp. 4M-Z18 TaxID=2293567 RepID=UPI000E2F7BA5|nr:NF038122 family metalloprotease [Methylovirgula sp. 4M-Z18]RFB80350.1 hypothetical protein DYH55_02155 [Methylovirgula sp. 4M-Z18]